MGWLKKKRVTAALLASVTACMPAYAQIGEVPVIGGVFNSTQVLKNQITASLSYSTRFARDMTLFTIGGMTLETYLLTLPLDNATKLRVMGQVADPSYAIPLGYFLHQFYDRYTGVGNQDQFKAYLKTVYDTEVLTGFEHTLFQVSESIDTAPKQHAKDQAHQEGIKIDRQFIATMVTLYDALVQIGEWQNLDHLPEQYTYLTQSEQDLALVAKVQPLVVNIIKQAASGMEQGEMKQALMGIVADGTPARASQPNNKAQALTITLIDFVRLNVLKAYRQFIYQDERAQTLNQWLKKAFVDRPQQALDFLQSQQERRFAVQITVDGLQQGLMAGLVNTNKPFIKQAYQQHIDRAKLNSSVATGKPEHVQSTRFLQVLAEQSYQDPNYLPFFKQLYQNYAPTLTQVGISSTPTISVRNLPIIKTGAKVSGDQGTGIPNFHFVDRNEDRAYYFFGNDALQLDRLIQKNRVQTMFDRLVHLKTLNCNAQYDWNAHTTFDGLVNLGAGETLRDFGEKRCLRELQERANVEIKLHRFRQSLIDNIRDYQAIPFWSFYTKLTRKWKIKQDIKHYAELDGQGMPDYTLIYNPWPDHFAHFVGPFSDEIIMPTGELNRLDYWIRQIEQTYQTAGIYRKTLWGMAGDHGLSPVYSTLNPEKAIFGALATKLDYPLVIKKISSDEGEGPKITNALQYPSNRGIDVVVASTAGGNFMMDMFNAHTGWAIQPIYSELAQWQPINAPDNESLDIIAESIHALKDSLDYLVVREQACTESQCKIRLVAQRNGQRVDEWITKEGNRFFYEIGVSNAPPLLEVQSLNPYLTKPDPNQLEIFADLVTQCVEKADKHDPQSWCTSEQWRELTRYTPRPDSVVQLANLYAEPTAGTINLFPREGIGYNTKVPGRHAGESYLEKDAFLGFWGAPIGRQPHPLTAEENGSLAPTLYQYLTGENVVEGKDGWGYPSLLNKLDIQ
ncbi:alkaline phosphatase family protein [Vibrio ostreicida]|uniref:Alkaline phosphatase family protein n=1 Tax=Vibrio ostreicida TaxID=526588 RepID=A0ABT8BYP8_9VIBR|nr:alkaline phosphatase family protein [Vibrio ostreicida]MDN3612211.1 alkaline phosphatase family protein [Vibrio ostreicida]NPD08605.1 nucleotide pyrophosphatase [Vibrio ostreicida]